MDLRSLLVDAERLATNLARAREAAASPEPEQTLRMAEALAWSVVDDIDRALRIAERRRAA